MSCKIGDQLKDRSIEAVIAEDNYANPEKGLAGGYAFEIEKATLAGKTAAARALFRDHHEQCKECNGRNATSA